MTDNYVTIVDFGDWSVVEESTSENTAEEYAKILAYCKAKERKSRKRKKERKIEIETKLSGAFLGLFSVGVPIILFWLWLFEII